MDHQNLGREQKTLHNMLEVSYRKYGYVKKKKEPPFSGLGV